LLSGATCVGQLSAGAFELRAKLLLRGAGLRGGHTKRTGSLCVTQLGLQRGNVAAQAVVIRTGHRQVAAQPLTVCARGRGVLSGGLCGRRLGS
jgi:hypothetical protein